MPRQNPPRKSRLYGARGYPHRVQHPFSEAQSPPTPQRTMSFGDFPLDIAKLIYEAAVDSITEVHIAPSGPPLAITAHPFRALNSTIRAAFLETFASHHRASCYVVKVQDFNFGRLIRYFQTTHGRHLLSAVPELVTIARHHIKTADLEHGNLIKFLKFAKPHPNLSVRHVVCGMPAAAQRRGFMKQLHQLEKEVRDELPDVVVLGEWFRFWWGDDGQGEYDWARDEGDCGMDEGDAEFVDPRAERRALREAQASGEGGQGEDVAADGEGGENGSEQSSSDEENDEE